MINFTMPDFSDIEDDLNKFSQQETHDLVVKIFEGVVRYSPVLRGHFRASWRAKVGGLDTTFIREGGTEESPLAPPPTPILPLSFTPVTISNSSPYANKIENGYSKKAPAGVLDVTLNDLGLL